MELQNLKELAERLRNDFASNFDSSDRELPNTFKEKVKKINTFNLKYNKYSVIFKGEKGALDSYIPNINIYIAAYYNQYTKELFKYKKVVEEIISQNKIDGDLKTFFNNERNIQKEEDSLFLKMLETQDISTSNKELLFKFVTNYEWWGGGKTIDRPDFFHSAILSVIGVTAAANVTLAYICGHLAENEELIDILNSHNSHNEVISRNNNSANSNIFSSHDEYHHIIIDIPYDDIECNNEQDLINTLSKDTELQDKFDKKSTLANFAYLKYHKLFKKIGCESKAKAEPILTEANLYTYSTGSGSGISPIINLIKALEGGNCCGVQYYDTGDTIKLTSHTHTPQQIIYFGSPGTGKSFGIKKLLLNHHIDEDKKIGIDRLFRTTFHPDSDYASFVGSYKPMSKRRRTESLTLDELKQEYSNHYNDTINTNGDFIRKYAENIKHEARRSSVNKVIEEIFGKGSEVTYYSEMVNIILQERNENLSNIVYEFEPQIFTQAYIRAWEGYMKGEDIFLIIEEINRGNCAQIFGDLFQLLDRKQDGTSEYKTKADYALKEHLEKKLGKGHIGIANGELTLPPNLHILATMNTSDQSLFPMDSAFKRRWSWEYIPIKKTCEDSQFKISIGDLVYPWANFITKVNERILSLTESEDKQLGNFFIKKDIDQNEFKSKVMFYLWSEVCKEYYNAGSFFKYKNIFNGEDKEIEFTFSQLFNDNDTYILQGFMSYLDVKANE